jgi:poly-gamma-glutamate synthesis protein (capsule biosynthesis protein)
VDKKQPELAHAAINAGAHIVYGTNPRVLLPIEEYNGGVIFYSLGRFCYGNDAFPTDYDTAIIQQEVVLSKDGEEAETLKARLKAYIR